MKGQTNKPFLFFTIALPIVGFLAFTSASLGLLTNTGAKFTSVVSTQLAGLIVGLILLYVFSRINYKFWQKISLIIFILAVLVNILVFIPQVGFTFQGAQRWIVVGNYSFQPSEFLKIAFLIYFASWLSGIKDKVKTFKYGLLPFLILIGILSFIYIKQTDTDPLIISIIAGGSMYLVAGARIRHIVLAGIIGIIGFSILAYSKPYIMERIDTFIHPAQNSQTSGYQIQQSLIAVGSGKLYGRGFGQSIQKFNFLPEPIGDSIFAVWAEEFGFIGGVILLILFLGYSLTGLKIASKSNDTFGRLIVVGIVILILSQALLNICAMVGIIPLSGFPLLFVSHGGTALVFALLSSGIILSVSRGRK